MDPGGAIDRRTCLKHMQWRKGKGQGLELGYDRACGSEHLHADREQTNSSIAGKGRPPVDRR